MTPLLLVHPGSAVGVPLPCCWLGSGFAPHERTCCVCFLLFPRRLPGHLVAGASIVRPCTARSFWGQRGFDPGGLGSSPRQWGRKTCQDTSYTRVLCRCWACCQPLQDVALYRG